MRNIGIVKNILYIALISVLVIVAVAVVAGRFGIGGARALVVQSGSMEPSIPTKSVVFTYPTQNYNSGDVITFKQSGRDEVLVTHRVVSVVKTPDGKLITTKGDANEDPDGEAVAGEDVVGKVLFSIPFVGSIVSFAQTVPGFIILIVVPTVAIIYSEILNIKKEILQMYSDRKQKKKVGISYD